MPDLPEFDNPPVVEVAVGIQFRPLFNMRGLALAPLRERWRPQYPRVEEQPAVPPVVEGGPQAITQVQFTVAPFATTRQLFLSESGNQLVQVQPDRMVVNWRSGELATEYPRYGHMREMFTNRYRDLAQFVADEGFGEMEVTQAELTYINVLDVEPGQVGQIGRFLKGWSGVAGHHLGEPEQARVTLTFPIAGIGQPPVRLYVEVSPAQKPLGNPVIFLTLTVRGNPGGRGLDESLKFMDEAHQHLVRSFAELTAEEMHEVWGRRS